MISLLVDESFVFDFISIIEVKISKCKDKKKKFTLQSQLRFYKNNLQEQIGDQLFEKVINSKFYLQLKDINKDVFELIDYSVHYSTEFRLGNQLNMKRFELKNAIQENFFGRLSSEIKLMNPGGQVNPD